jgi:hypothetical protein
MIDEAQYTLRMLGLALEDLASVRKPRSRKSAAALVTMAKTKLSAALEAHAADATRELGGIIMVALGGPQEFLAAEMSGAHRMLSLLLDALPETPLAGGAAERPPTSRIRSPAFRSCSIALRGSR